MPAVAMALVVMLLGVLLWLLHRNEVEEANAALIKDILWVEQDIYFHLTSAEEKLTQLAAELGHDDIPAESFEVQARN
ncbi:MAG TPA: PAS domain-containing sensor histidine kinase, partial [Rhodocyclaceae bacterium]|nr:PAS domain-containing sensor histidine kinase [Rhodocyclaceae bacterium]